MDKKSATNASKLQRIVSIRNEDDDETTSSKLSNTNPFSTQHDILKYSATNSSTNTKQSITKRHFTSSLNNINLESEKVLSYPTGSLSRKIVSSSNKEDIEYSTSTQQSKPLRKVAVVNSNNVVFKNHYAEDNYHLQQQQQLGGLFKSSSSSIIFNTNKTIETKCDFDSFSATASSSTTTTASTNKLISTASSWRAGEALVQKQLKQHLKQQLKQQTDQDLITANRRHQLNKEELSTKQKQQSQPKRSEFHSMPIQAASTQQIKPKTSQQASASFNIKPTKNIIVPTSSSSSKAYDLEHKNQKIKRIYENKSDKERLKREDEERKRKLQEIYRKQRSSQLDPRKEVKASNSTTTNPSTSLTDSKQLISNKFLYEQDMSKILLDKITHLLNDNDKLVEKQRQQFSTNKRPYIDQHDLEDDDEDNEDTDFSVQDNTEETMALRNVTNFEDKKHHETERATNSTYSYKHDRLKKICSMALDLQTKLQQTKLKLFGLNPNDESILYYGNNVNNINEDIYDEENKTAPIKRVIAKPSTALTPNMAARRIQIAYRKYLNRRRKYLKKNQQHHINLIKYNNMNTTESNKPAQQLIKNGKFEQLQHIHNQYNYHSINEDSNDEYNLLLKKKINLSTAAASTSKFNRNQISLLKTTMEQNDLIYDNDYTADDLIRNNSKKLIINNIPKYELNKSLLSNSSNSSTTETNLSKYISNQALLPVKKSSKSITTRTNRSNEDESINSTSEESISTSSTSSSTSNTLTNGSLSKSKNKSLEIKVISSPSSAQRTTNKSAPQLKLQSKIRSLSYTKEEATKESRYSPCSIECLTYLDTSEQDVPQVSKSMNTKQITADEFENKIKIQLPKRSLSANASSLVSTLTYLDSPETDNILNKRVTKKTRESFHNIDHISDLMGSVNIGDNRRATICMGVEDDDELEKSFRALLPSESHLKKSKQFETNKEHSFLYSMNDMSQTSFSSQFDNQANVRISFEDDSFKKFTGEIVKKYMQEEEMRSKHQANLLKLREKALIDKTNAELTWLEQMKKKVQDKGEDEKMPSILKKEKGIMQKLKEEQENINQMKEVQRKATENRLKILSQHSEVIKWCQNKLKKHNNSSSLAETAVETSIKTTAINDSTSDVIENDLLYEQNNQLDESSNINQSLIESKVLKQVKQHLNSEKYLTEREKKLRLRRKHAEEIIAWKKKLDDEELQVREIEKKANLALISKNEPCLMTPTVPLVVVEPATVAQCFVTEKNKSNLKLLSEEESIQKSDISSSETIVSVNNSVTLEKKNEKTKSTEQTTITCITQYTSTHHKTKESNQSELDTLLLNLTDEKIVHKDPNDILSDVTLDQEHKVKELKNELILKKNEAEKLRQSLKTKEKSKLKQKEELLRKKITSYDNLIDKIKTALDSEQQKQAEAINQQQKEATEQKCEILIQSKFDIESIEAKECPDNKIVESIVQDLVINDTIDQMIEIRDKKNVKLAADFSLPQPQLKQLSEHLLDLKIPYNKEKIEYLSDIAVETYFWKRLQSNQSLKSIQDELIDEYDENLIHYYKVKNEEDKQNELIFKKMLLDLIAELMHDLYLERYESSKALFKFFPNVVKMFKKHYFKSLMKGPVNMNEAKLLIRTKLVNLLSNDLNNNDLRLTKWRTQKPLDLVDSILDYEMREQEYEWSNYEPEEYEAKILITNSIFDMILKDTIDCFQVNLIKKFNDI